MTSSGLIFSETGCKVPPHFKCLGVRECVDICVTNSIIHRLYHRADTLWGPFTSQVFGCEWVCGYMCHELDNSVSPSRWFADRIIKQTRSPLWIMLKYLRAGPPRCPFGTGTTVVQTISTRHIDLVEMKNPTRLSNKTSTARSCAEDQILENKISGTGF